MIGASSLLGTNRPVLRTVSAGIAAAPSRSPPSSQAACSARALSSATCRQGRQDERLGAHQPDGIGQCQHGDDHQRKQRVECAQRAAAARGCEREDDDQQQQEDRSRRRQQQEAGLDRPGEPGIAAALSDDLPGMQQQQRPERPRQHQGAEVECGRGEGQQRHGQQHGQHRLLGADHRAGQMIERDEGRDPAELGQHVDAEHVAAGGAIGDVGEPDRQGRPEIGADLVFAAEGQQGREAAGRAAIKHQRHEQPHRGLEQHGDPDDQPRPRANELDDQGGKPHATSERCSQPVKPALFAHDCFDRGRDASWQPSLV